MLPQEFEFGKLFLGTIMVVGMFALLILGFCIVLPAWWEEKKKIRRENFHKGKNYIWHSNSSEPNRRVYTRYDDWK